MLEAEKKRSKGGFLQLFDWNGKSRKKLFSNNPELDDEPKKGKEIIGTMAKSLLQVIEVDESRASSSNKGSSELNCASSVTSDEGYGTRAPGVVARLMGLDSLPTSNVPEPCSTPYPDLRSRYDRSVPNLCSENHSVDFPNFPGKEWISCNQVESRQRKVQNRPIERFQTEMLPPKSAKSIPITHHKLLSPIKNPGIVPTRNTAYIVEAAAKIIEASPQAATKGKRPSVESSVPLRIWDLKERMETTQRISWPQNSNESVAAKFTKGQHRHQSQRDSTPAVKASANLGKRSPENLRKKGKSVSMAVQARVNVQSRDVSASSSSSGRSSMNQKEKSGAKANQFCTSQQDSHRTAQKGTPTNRAINVLRQNNQKQNHILNKDRSNFKASAINRQVRKSKSTGGSIGPHRTVNKVVANSETGSRRAGLITNDTRKELSSSKAKNLFRKKQSANGDSPSEESAGNEMKKDERSIKCNIAIEGGMNRGTDNRKSGMDVVSFTFSSPIRSRSDLESSGRIMGTNNSFNIDHFGDNNQLYLRNSLSSPGLNIIGGDALSVLLDKKFMELTCKVESSHCNVIGEGTSGLTASSLPDSASTPSVVTAEESQRLQVCLDNSNSDSVDNSCSTSNDNSATSINPNWQFRQSEAKMHSSSSYNYENGREFDCERSCSISSLEHSYTSVSCSDIGNSTSDSMHFSLAQDQAESTWISTDVSVSVDCESELYDSASSISVWNTGKKHMTRRTFSLVDETESNNWEFDYLRELLDNAGLTMTEFALGQTDQVITPSLFNQLENQENKPGRNIDGYSKLGRKVLFDYVCECLDFKCQQFFIGNCKGWSKWVTLLQRKGWLAEELYKEMLGWNGMGDLMVDELVDQDMSSQHGKWLDFDIEAFEEGVEIESMILTSLIDELVYDFLPF